MQPRASGGANQARADAVAPRLELIPSRQLVPWMAEHQVSIAFTTYQAGKLFLLGRREGEQLTVFERSFNRCMGLCASGERLYLSTLYQLWRLENYLEPGAELRGYDRLYVPQLAYTTGDLDIHDIVVEPKDGRVVFANTLFSCLATLSERHSFAPLWTPPFISRLAAEDRCHLNGVALRDGRARYVTAVAATDIADGWRERRRDGGVVVDVEAGEIIASGLSMPHSPRWWGGRLWLLESGSGRFGYVDLDRGRFEAVAFCPGYLRGLAFVEDCAVVGLSKPREPATFRALPVGERLAAEGVEPRCGLAVIDLRSGDAVHWLRIEGIVEELYDVALLPGVRRPMALGFQTDEIRRTLSVGPGPGER